MQPQEIVVFDALHPCSYLPGRTARLPYRHPAEKLTPEQFDARLAAGDRRSGIFLYRPQCPTCRACQSIRLDVTSFRADATQRRMQRRGDALLTVRIGRPVVDEQRVRLFNRHRDERGLTSGDDEVDLHSYAEFLTDTCCDTIELSYWHEDRLVAVAIADAGRQSLSAVYCYYDPSFRLLSLGTYSILRQVEICREAGRHYLYLGLFIAESTHMSYKARFRPHQRLIEGVWTEFQ
jgi:arginine-tRNA-protein transferase